MLPRCFRSHQRRHASRRRAANTGMLGPPLDFVQPPGSGGWAINESGCAWADEADRRYSCPAGRGGAPCRAARNYQADAVSLAVVGRCRRASSPPPQRCVDAPASVGSPPVDALQHPTLAEAAGEDQQTDPPSAQAEANPPDAKTQLPKDATPPAPTARSERLAEARNQAERRSRKRHGGGR